MVTAVMLAVCHPCCCLRERAGAGLVREGMVRRGRESLEVSTPGSVRSLCLEKSTAGLSPSGRAGLPVAFLVTPQRTGAVGSLLLLPY